MKNYPGMLAAFGDGHSNSDSGLMPPKIYGASGNSIGHNPFQAWMWDKFLRCCDEIGEEKERAKLPLAVVLNGDSLDKNIHAPEEMLVLNEAAILANAVATYQPIIDIADFVYVIRGTPAHTGKGSHLEEQLGKALGAISPNPGAIEQKRQHSWWHLDLEIGEVTFDIQHHAESSSRKTWTVGGGALRIAKTVYDEYNLTGDIPPDVVLRNHNHHWEDSGTNYLTRAFMLPAWQGPTNFTHRIAMGAKVHPVGAIMFDCGQSKRRFGNRKYDWAKFMYSPERRESEKVFG